MSSKIIKFPNKEKYQCPVCYNLMREPIQLEICGHNLCKCCWEKIQEQNRMCPICRQYTNGFIDNRMKRELANEIVICHCESKQVFSLIGEHLKVCPKILLPCKVCGDDTPCSDLLEHVKICPKFFIECTDCLLFVRRGELVQHKEFYCKKSATCVKISCQICPDKKEIPVTIFQRHYEREHLGKSKTVLILPKIIPEFTID